MPVWIKVVSELPLTSMVLKLTRPTLGQFHYRGKKGMNTPYTYHEKTQ